jgi:acyl-CoA synthetase (NDP forming)
VAGAVILSAGFAEIGEGGKKRQIALVERAREAGIRLIGPNCLGFINYLANAPVWTNQVRRPMPDPTIAVVSQSGATAQQISLFAYQQRIGLTHMISTGNEADIDVGDVIDYLSGEDDVRAIALFMESSRDPEKFVASVRKAQVANKPVVVLKVGSSEAAAKAAQAHTGSLVGDDRVFSAVCEMLNMPRANSIEDLVTVADLISRVGPIEPQGVALVGMSGGMCEIATDNAEDAGVAFPQLCSSTYDALRATLPEMATPGNPLDITGAAMLKPELIEQSLAAIASDPQVGLVACLFDSPSSKKTAGVGKVFLRHIGEGLKKGGKPSLMISHSFLPVSRDSRELADEAGITYTGSGISGAVCALGHLTRWSRARKQAPPRQIVPSDKRPATEREVLAFLEEKGVPVIPGVLTTDAEAAVAAASGWQDPAVLKVVSPDIAHKTEVGGVALGLKGADEIREAWTGMMARVKAAKPEARIQGIVVSPMRDKGVELFVGTIRDPQWGPAIAVGLGGVLIEALKDSSLRMLPVNENDVLDMLEELRGKALLDGFRGASPIDRAVLARAVVAIGDAALALGDDLESLEVNPLRASGTEVEALDGLVIWSDGNSGAEK